MQSWEVSDELWAKRRPLLAGRNSAGWGGDGVIAAARVAGASRCRRGRFSRRSFNVLRTGCQWKALPKNFGSASAIHAHFQRWRHAGFFLRLWQAGLAEYDELERNRVRCRALTAPWQSPACARGRRPQSNGSGKKKGTKRKLVVDARGARSRLSSAARTA